MVFATSLEHLANFRELHVSVKTSIIKVLTVAVASSSTVRDSHCSWTRSGFWIVDLFVCSDVSVPEQIRKHGGSSRLGCCTLVPPGIATTSIAIQVNNGRQIDVWGECLNKRIPGVTRTAIVIVSLVYCANSVGDEAMRERFLAEYPAAERRLREYYSTLRIVCEEKVTFNDEKVRKQSYTSQKLVYLANHGNIRIDREYFGLTEGRGAAVSGFVLGPEGQFIVDRKVDGGDYLIREAGATALGTPRELPGMFAALAPVAFVPFSPRGTSIIGHLQDPSFVIEDASISGTNPQLMTVKWKWGPLPPGSIGEWVFDISKCWALVSHHNRQLMPDGKWKNVESIETIQYEGAAGDIPLVKGLETVAKLIDTGEIVDRRITTVSEIVPSDANADQFTLAAYGLSYAQGVPANRTGKWLIIAGMVGISLVFLGRWIFRRWQGGI